MKKIIIIIVFVLFMITAVFASLVGSFKYGFILVPCVHCSYENSWDQKYCEKCNDLTYNLNVCPSCGEKNIYEDKICIKCANLLPRPSWFMKFRIDHMKNRYKKDVSDNITKHREILNKAEQAEKAEVNKLKRLREKRERESEKQVYDQQTIKQLQEYDDARKKEEQEEAERKNSVNSFMAKDRIYDPDYKKSEESQTKSIRSNSTRLN